MIHLPEAQAGRAQFFASVFNRAVLALAVMTGFWHWLAGVWKQQLDNGQSWTTAGRLIRPSERVGYLVGATGVLVALHLAFWPRLPYVDITDASTSRWVWGLLANGLLILALTAAARRTGKSTLAWLALFALGTCSVFVLIRSAGSAIHTGFVQYWPLVLAALAGIALLSTAPLLRSRTWRPFFEPTYLVGILILPVAAIGGTTIPEIRLQAMPTWVPTATFGLLAGVYGLAAWIPGPRRFLLLAAVCLAGCLWNVLQLS